jgi:serine/threonine protein kinase
MSEKIIFGKYRPEIKLGEGSFGKIYSATNIQTGEKFALKFEDRKSSHNLLEGEACILRYLQGSKFYFFIIK